MKIEKATAGIHRVRSNGSSPKEGKKKLSRRKAVALILGCRRAARLHPSCPTCTM